VALEALSRDALAKITERFGLAVHDRRSAAAHVDALMRSHTVDFGALRGHLQRDDLKEMCEALGLDTSGREKGVLSNRIVAGPTPSAVRNGHGRNGTPAQTAEVQPPSGGKLTLEQLEGYLWGAADKLRGKIDSSDYKSFIFGFLFLNRISDVFEEEAEKLIAAGTASLSETLRSPSRSVTRVRGRGHCARRSNVRARRSVRGER